MTHEREEAARGPYTKLTGAEILAKDYSNHPLDQRLYGRWRCQDGREVLFNRSYRPLWERRPGEPVKMADPGEWVNWDTETFYWDDRAGGTSERGHRLLKKWGLE